MCHISGWIILWLILFYGVIVIVMASGKYGKVVNFNSKFWDEFGVHRDVIVVIVMV